MKKFVKISLSLILVAALLAGAGTGFSKYYKKKNEVEIMVVPVSEVNSQVYEMENSLNGTITTSVNQRVNLDDDAIVQQVYVTAGQKVNKGDKILELDMTLREMEQNINRLSLQNYENALVKSENRLQNLRNGGPIDDENYREPDVSLPDSSINSDTLTDSSMEGGNILAAAWRNSPVLLAAIENLFTEDAAQTEETPTEAEPIAETPIVQEQTPEITEEEMLPEPIPTEAPVSTEVPVSPEETEAPIEPEETPAEIEEEIILEGEEELTPTPDITPEPTIPGSDGEDLFTGQTPVLYKVLDGESVPFQGTGTEEDPFLFLCSTENGGVTAMGSFLNKMAGFQEEGETRDPKEGYWYLIEFYDETSFFQVKDDNFDMSGDMDMTGDPETDMTDGMGMSTYSDSYETFDEVRKDLCLGYFLINGGLLDKRMKDTDMIEYLLEDSTIPDKEEPMDNYGIGDFDYGGDLGDEEVPSSMTRAEAISQVERNIASMKIDIRKLKLRISKLDKVLENKIIYSKIDGVVKTVGKDGNSLNDSYVVIESEKGYYVKGTVSEMYLDEFEPGTIITGYSYDTGVRFEAEVEQVAEYPEEDSADYGFSYFGGSSNTNASNYGFTAKILDDTLEFSEDQWITLSFKTNQSESVALNIPKAFIRTENGLYYVYKDENGLLAKTYVKAGSSKDGGYTLPVKGGISMSDYLAFPYGQKVKDGVKTKIGSVNDLYDESTSSLY